VMMALPCTFLSSRALIASGTCSSGYLGTAQPAAHTGGGVQVHAMGRGVKQSSEYQCHMPPSPHLRFNSN
jgi:hypothetical protein